MMTHCHLCGDGNGGDGDAWAPVMNVNWLAYKCWTCMSCIYKIQIW